MKHISIASIFGIVWLLVLASCTSDKPKDDNTADYLIGRWNIEEATRNDQQTESLAKLFYEFFEDGTMRTNLTGSTQTGTYQLEDKQILQRETPMDADYNIEEITDSTLIMNTSLRGQAFRFRFSKEKMEE
ncbi:MAG: hypothetical protein MRY78_11805 [Saprospiraceae bacterium]|nr:hypothetical protein [Saprospiraceae bacterium]